MPFCGQTVIPVDRGVKIFKFWTQGWYDLCNLFNLPGSQFLHLQKRDKNHLLGEDRDEFYFGQAKFEEQGGNLKLRQSNPFILR